MTTRIILLAALLMAGAAMGWLLANHWNDPEHPEATVTPGSITPVVEVTPQRSEHEITPQTGLQITKSQSADSNEKKPSPDVLAQIHTRLESETAQRRLLERRVQELSDKLASLESITPASTGRPFAAVASATAAGETSTDPEVRAKARTARFLAAGFDTEEEKELTRRMDEVAMERLYLRDRARREGWRRTPEYREAARSLRNEVRDDIGDDSYDRLLYANEQDNRVLVEKVLESSPAQEIGLQLGDMILSYDGMRVFSNRDIRTARRNGEPEDPVPLRIERNGEILELEIPRGPLGIHLDTKSVLP